MSDEPEEVGGEVEVVAAPVVPPEPLRTFAASEDPRAMAGIRRAKGMGGLAGFALTGMAAHMHGELMASVLLRALVGGLAGYLIAWLAAVTIWRRIIRAEVRHSLEALASRRRAATAQSDVQ